MLAIANPDLIERLLREDVITARALAVELPPVRGKRRRPETVARWIRDGHRGIQLEGWKGPMGWMTTRQALARFMARITGQELEERGTPPPQPTSFEKQARKDQESLRRMKDELKQKGRR